MNFQSTRFSCRIGDFDKYFAISFQIFASSFLRNLKRSEKLSTFFFVPSFMDLFFF